MKLKSCLCFLLISLLFVIVSCSNEEASITVYQENDTLRSDIQNKSIRVLWTNEFEGNILTENLHSVAGVADGVELSINGVKGLKKNNPVYPQIKGFAGLDTSMLSSEAKSFIKDFCGALSANMEDTVDAYFKSEYIFNYVFFMQDIKEAWNKISRTAYPPFYAADSKKKDKLFTKFILGESYEMDEDFLIPVRCISSEGFIDILICLNLDGNKSIREIEVLNWGKNNG